MIKQFIPSDYCLNKCHNCCRFSQSDSIWAPSLLNEEIQILLKNNFLPSIISNNKKIRLLPYSNQNNLSSTAELKFICPFLEPQDNKCKIYSFRPFECQLYPFLINCRNKKIFLAVDLGCPFVKEKINLKEFKEHVQYLTNLFNNPNQLDKLKNNPQIIQEYQDALNLVELNIQ